MSLTVLVPPAFALLQSAIGIKGIISILITTVGTHALNTALSSQGYHINVNDLLNGNVSQVVKDFLMGYFIDTDSSVLFVMGKVAKGIVSTSATSLYYGAKAVYFLFKGSFWCWVLMGRGYDCCD